MVFRKLTPYLIGVPLGLAAWALILVLVALFLPVRRPVAVYAWGGTSAALDAIVAAGGAILEVRGNLVLAVSDDPWFVAHLYREAPLVALLADGGCGFTRPNRVRRQARRLSVT
jgi:hypothetical protein